MVAWKDKFINVNKFSRSGRKITEIRKLVIHYTANNGGTAMNHYNYFNNLKDRYASAHIFVDKIEALCIIPLSEMAYHAGDVQKRNPDGSAWRGVQALLPSANNLSIGVEMCVEKDGTFHPDTIARTEDVFVDLCKKFNLDPIYDIVRHYDVTRKNCPAPWVANSQLFENFKKNVKAKLGGAKPVASVQPTQSSTLPLKKGDSGSKVVELQNLLNKKGYSLVADGDFGTKTDVALRDFQAKNALVVDGICGNATWDKLTYVAPVVQPKLEGWKQVGEKWFYYGQKGWLLYKDNYYYIKDNNEMTEGWLKLDSIWFYLDPKQEGKMVKGWFKDETNNWFFANDKGKCLFGLQTINEKKYYISSNGMVTGFICIDKQWKFFNEDGILATDVELAVKSVKVNSDGSIEKIIN